MPYTQYTTNTKLRILISGFPNSGKTTSLPTFLYGPYDYWSENAEEHEKAVKQANDKKMVILVAPGEFGTRSLPTNTEHITSYYYETTESDDVRSARWSTEALSQFNSIWKEVVDSKPDILVIDGLHALWTHIMNRITEGDYLNGVDLNMNPRTGQQVQFRAAGFHSRTHNTFNQYVAGLYTSSIQTIIATTWEDWQSGTSEGQKPGDIAATRYLWPAIGGKMAQEVVGKFDARLSARREKRCCTQNCKENDEAKDHYVWQFLPKGDVQGVGIKGIKRYTQAMIERPFIHQNGNSLLNLIKMFS
jgi:hypothetical protein